MLRPLFLVFKFFFRFLLLLIVARVLIFVGFSSLVVETDKGVMSLHNLFENWFMQGVIYDVFVASYIAKGAFIPSLLLVLLPLRVLEKLFKLLTGVLALSLGVVLALAIRGGSIIHVPLTYTNIGEFFDLFSTANSEATGMDTFMVVVLASLFFVFSYRSIARSIGGLYEFSSLRTISERVISTILLIVVSSIFLSPAGNGLRDMANRSDLLGNKQPSNIEFLLIQGPVYNLVEGAIDATLEELDKYAVPIEPFEATEVEAMEMHMGEYEEPDSAGELLIGMDGYEE